MDRRGRPALDLVMPNWAATARTVTPLRNRAAASSRWLGLRSGVVEVRLPSEEKLRTELQLAGKKFDKSPAAMWRVLKKYYRASDAHLGAPRREVREWV
jgi:hypothetical protein